MEKEIRIRQQDRNDCAAACVASVCAHYGLKLPLIRIREACGTSADGTTMQGVIDACGKLGLEAAGLKSKNKDIDSLRKVDRPVILHLEKKNGWLHFVVLYGMGKDHARIMDPEDGRMHRSSLKELEEEWSGYIIAVTPSPMFRKRHLRQVQGHSQILQKRADAYTDRLGRLHSRNTEYLRIPAKNH